MPQIYGVEHIIYLLIIIPFMVFATLWIKKAATTEEKLQKERKKISKKIQKYHDQIFE